MSTPNDGGPAFPQPQTQGGDWPFNGFGMGGLTARDFFAAFALAGLLSDPHSTGNDGGFGVTAYRYADAMLKAREAPTT